MQNDHANLVEWQTIQEHDTRYFEVERSEDARNFSTIGRVTAAGNSNKPLSYNYLDEQLIARVPIYYYRIRQVDVDGRYNYSQVVKVIAKDAADRFEITVAPNPGVTAQMGLSVNAEEQPYNVSLTNVSGAVIWHEEIVLNSYPKKVLPKLAAGTYFLSVKGNGLSDTKKIVVK
jgi:hypothetical protein